MELGKEWSVRNKHRWVSKGSLGSVLETKVDLNAPRAASKGDVLHQVCLRWHWK